MAPMPQRDLPADAMKPEHIAAVVRIMQSLNPGKLLYIGFCCDEFYIGIVSRGVCPNCGKEAEGMPFEKLLRAKR